MTDFISMEGKFYIISTKIGEVILMGLLWTIFSLPIITIGASTTALYYVCTKKSSGKDQYILKSFLKSFKENFAKATIVFLILLLLLYIVWINIYSLGHVDMGWLTLPVTIALYFVLMQIVVVATHVFCIISRFENTVLGFLKSAIFMAYRHFLTTISNLVLMVILLTISMLYPVMITFFMGIYIYLSSFGFVKIFRKHHPDFDKPIDPTLKVS